MCAACPPSQNLLILLPCSINLFKTEYKFKFKEFWLNHKNKSSLLQTLFDCSCKMTSMMFYMMRSKGPILVYSNYVKMEGLEIFKIYLHLKI